jgi:hypothetical protein
VRFSMAFFGFHLTESYRLLKSMRLSESCTWCERVICGMYCQSYIYHPLHSTESYFLGVHLFLFDI